ncbi:MAG: T9SS type A sorting domain-containing protein [Bacteroidetes bacterium]|nr:T9SS type A sorting domain-containing protein [Bacteroidota bacterium]
MKANNVCGSSGNRILAITFNCREQLPVSTNQMKVSVFPNPASDFMNITFESENKAGYQLVISDVSGKILNLVTGETNEGINEAGLDVSQLPNGIISWN